MIFTSSHAESCTDSDTGDGCVVMKFVYLFEFTSVVVDLEEKTILTAYVDSPYFSCLLQWIWIIKVVLKVEHCEDRISGVMVENDR